MMDEDFSTLGPEDFKGKLYAPISPWFNAWGRELGGSPEAKLQEAKKLVKSRFARGRLGKMLQLTSTQFEGILTDPKVDADPLWRPVAEEYLGAKFARPEVPDSAALVNIQSRITATEPAPQERKAKANGKSNTIGARISAEQKEKQLLPAAMLDVIDTPCPALNNINQPDFTKATTEVCAAFYCEHGTLSMGAPMVRHFGKLMRNWVRPPIDAKGNTRWPDPTEKALAIKLSNWDRKDARVNPSPVLEPPAPASQLDACVTSRCVCDHSCAEHLQGRNPDPASGHVRESQ
jgi:hypothetical protein